MTPDEEEKIVRVVHKMLVLGFGFDANTLADLIQELIQGLVKVNPDRNTKWDENRPDSNFIRHFVDRHDLVYRVTMELSNSRAAVSDEEIRLWFNDVENALVKNPEFADCFLDPKRIYNVVREIFIVKGELFSICFYHSVKMCVLTLIPYPGAIFFKILFSFLRVELIVRKFSFSQNFAKQPNIFFVPKVLRIIFYP